MTKGLRQFMAGYRDGVDAMVRKMEKAGDKFEKEFVRKGDREMIVDTLSTAMVNIKMCLDEMKSTIKTRSQILEQEIMMPLEKEMKRYCQ